MESTLANLIDLYDAGKLTRRQLVASLVAAAGMGSVTGKARAAAGPTFQGTRLNHPALSVTELPCAPEGCEITRVMVGLDGGHLCGA